MSSASGDASLVGRPLGRYRVLERIGGGGMGQVYLARDERLERDVALKVLNPDTVSDDKARERFRREALALSRLNHPNIATIFDFDSRDGIDFLVMEHVAGEPLARKLESGPLPELEAVRLQLQLTEGLAAAHQQGVVHRDLKPGNLCLTPDRRLKILDFGIARLVRPTGDDVTTAAATETRSFAGTLPYMAPEQLRGEALDPRTDIWAAGVVLYEMLAGRHPFGSRRPERLIKLILGTDPEPISRFRPDVPRRLQGITVTALEKRREDRYGSATEMADDLKEALKELEGASHVRRGSRVTSRRVRRRRLAAAAITSLVLGAAAAVFTRGLFVREANALPAIAVLPLTEGRMDFDQQVRLAARMLTTDLGESSQIRVLGSTALQCLLANRRVQDTSELGITDLRALARSAGLSHIATLSLLEAGGTLRADLEILDMSAGRTVATASEEVVGQGNLVRMIDPLAARARNALLSPKQLAAEQDRPFGDITSSSSQAVMLFYQAQEYEMQANAARAIELYNRALEIDPKFFLARLWRADYQEGAQATVEPEDAEKLSEYERLILETHRAMSAGDPAAMIRGADRILALRPGEWTGIQARYAGQYFSGMYRQCAESCERAIRNGYRTHWEHLFLNSAYVMTGLSREEIVERYRTLLEEDPTDAMTRFWLAITYLLLNRDVQAEQYLETVFSVYPDNDMFFRILSHTYAWRDAPDKEADLREATAYLDRMDDALSAAIGDGAPVSAEAGSPDWLILGVPMSFRRGEIAFLREDLPSAIEEYERALRSAPDFYPASYRLGVAYDRLGRREEATAKLRSYIDVTELNPYDRTAQGREQSCGATRACHSISRPEALDDAQRRLQRLN